MYLALRPPWHGEGSASAPLDAGVSASASDEPGADDKPRKKKKRRRPRTVAAPGGSDAPGAEPSYEETEPLVELTAAQRQLEWRGDDVTLPRTQLDMAGGGDARSLDDAEINATIASQSRGVQDCVVETATGTDLRATVTVKMLVDGAGRVTKSRVQAPRYLHGKGLLPCVRRALGRMKFPATGAPTQVTLPVNLG